MSQTSESRRVALASAVGTTIEWYDFFIYGTAAAVIFGPQFFPQVSELAGTLAAFALVKYKRFGGRTMFSGMVSAPLVMPEVVVGLSLLLMLVSVQRALGFPERGMMTIWLGHLLLGMAYKANVGDLRESPSLKLVELLRKEFDIDPKVVTGPATDNQVGRDIIRERTGVAAINAVTDAAELGNAVARSLGFKVTE